MREEVISQKVGNRSGIVAKRRSAGVTQRPTRRERERSETMGARVRALMGYLPMFLKLVLAIAAGLGIFAAYRAAAAASFFQIRQVEMQGNYRASAQDVEALVRREVGRTGVWQADLEDLSSKLERLPWVRVAIVSRVLPDGIRVRLAEREPRAVVRTASGRFLWVDDDAVQLGEMLPTDQMPPFFLRGWNEDGGEVATKENVERVKRFLALNRDWGAAGLSDRVSEVNLIDIRDVRAQLAGDDSQIEVRLGSQDFGTRLQRALSVLDQHRQTPRGPFISYVDLTQGKRAVIGFMSGAHAISNSVDESSDQTSEVARNAATSPKPQRDDRVSTQNATRENAKRERDTNADRNVQSGEKRPRRARPTQ